MRIYIKKNTSYVKFKSEEDNSTGVGSRSLYKDDIGKYVTEKVNVHFRIVFIHDFWILKVREHDSTWLPSMDKHKLTRSREATKKVLVVGPLVVDFFPYYINWLTTLGHTVFGVALLFGTAYNLRDFWQYSSVTTKETIPQYYTIEKC